jgi:hypothetical protein
LNIKIDKNNNNNNLPIDNGLESLKNELKVRDVNIDKLRLDILALQEKRDKALSEVIIQKITLLKTKKEETTFILFQNSFNI